MKTADENNSKVILANDPDADRLAVAEKLTKCVHLMIMRLIIRSFFEAQNVDYCLVHTNLMLNLEVDTGTFSRGMRLVPSLDGGAGSPLSRGTLIIQV